VVSTPQVLLDALRHSYISLGRDISLIVFDEAHHAIENHPYKLIMEEFYFILPTKENGMRMESAIRPGEYVSVHRPFILGLTASPVYGGNVELEFQCVF
jgi:endoribonuclease Dicer